MLRVETTSRFEKMLVRFVKAHPDLKERVRTIMKQLSRDPRSTQSKVHALSGPMRGCFAASITFRYRIVFILEPDTIWFIGIGSHDEVY